MNNVILVINSGSSSIKLSIYTYNQTLDLLYQGVVDNGSTSPCLTLSDANHQQILKQIIPLTGIEAGLRAFFTWFKPLNHSMKLQSVGHRIVHGGQFFHGPTLITDDVEKKIARLIPLAPSHQLDNLKAIQVIKELYPAIPQIACFDTSFHRTQEKLAKVFAIPRKLTNEGLIRYGFHGISYEYIASVANQYLGDIGNKRIIVAHLGHGASMCAMYQHQSVATTMGLTALDGLMMGSRCGSIDPGVLLYLMQEKNWSVEQVSTLLYHESGLLGVSGLSSDMRDLDSNPDPFAIEAVDLFCFNAAKELASLCGILQGCDAIIFTAGIGEHSPVIRKKIASRLAWLGVILDEKANNRNLSIISQNDSKITVAVIPTDENFMIAQHTINNSAR